MTLTLALADAGSGIAAIDKQLAVISQNVANAGTAGYVTENAPAEEANAGGIGEGVIVGPATRVTDAALTASVLTQNAAASAASTTSNALAAIDSASGTPGAGTDLPSLLGALTNAFTTLADSPGDQTAQRQVVIAAGTLTQGINALSRTYAAQRQAAQEAVVSDVATLNATLGTIGTLSTQIVALRAQGQSTADFENQRDAAIQSLSQITDVRVLEQPNGAVTLATSDGVILPTSGGTPFATRDATLGPDQSYPASVPAVTLNGVDVTRQLITGSLGANLVLRDQTLPSYQAALDETAFQLTSRFDAQGLTLFSRPDGSVPAASAPPAPVQTNYVGYATQVTVNPAVAANPSAVRDGTHDVAGSPGGASAFTVNPPGGPAGFTTLADRVLDYALGGDVQAGVAQAAVPSSGLGPAGGQSLGFSPPAALAGLAAGVTAAQSADAGQAAAESTSQTALQSALSNKLGSEEGVSVDHELTTLTQLQNAYGANAKVIAAVQTAWNELFAAVGVTTA